jgi:undecaprenyl-diphosphatase
VVLAVVHADEPLVRWDERVAHWVATELPSALEWLARPFTWLGGSVGLAVVLGPVCVGLVRRARVGDAALVALGVVGIEVLVAVLKTVFDRPRPDIDPVVRLPASASFPSGHAASAVVAAGVVVALLGAAGGARSRRHRALAAATLTVFAIGLSRVALGVHYVSDVVAGWCLGGAWLAACLLVRGALGRQPMRGDA